MQPSTMGIGTAQGREGGREGDSQKRDRERETFVILYWTEELLEATLDVLLLDSNLYKLHPLPSPQLSQVHTSQNNVLCFISSPCLSTPVFAYS